MNLIKKDLGRFRIFVSISNNVNTRYSHRHVDALSYVVFIDGELLLLDPGRATYNDQSWVQSSAHNGLSNQSGVLPKYRFWKGKKSRNDFRIVHSEGMGNCFVSLEHIRSGVMKLLDIRLIADDTGIEALQISEKISSVKNQNCFYSLNWLEVPGIRLNAHVNGSKINLQDSVFKRKYAHEYGTVKNALGITIKMENQNAVESRLQIALQD